MKLFSEEQREFFQDIISKVVDTTLHYLLSTVEEEEEIKLFIISDTKELIELKKVSHGLAGELYTEDGWITKYSNKRYIEP